VLAISPYVKINEIRIGIDPTAQSTIAILRASFSFSDSSCAGKNNTGRNVNKNILCFTIKIN
jgi:hypothetical protein